MKLSDSLIRRLVYLNSFVLLCLMVGVCFTLAWKRDLITKKISHLIQTQSINSKLLSSFSHQENSNFPIYSIKIKSGDYREIKALTTRLKETGILSNEKKQWFPIKFDDGNDTYKAKIRIKGDFANHWEKTKKSWRVKFKKKKLFRAYRELDFILPADKAYEVEKVASDLAREAGLLVPDVKFAQLKINGVDMGLYLMRENPGKETLERLRYPEGEIIRSQNIWTQTFQSGFGLHPYVNVYFSRFNKPVLDTYAASFTGTLKKHPMTGYAFARWKKLLELIRNSDNKEFFTEIESIVDIDKFLKWNAITWLFGSTHAHWGDNLRWYYDNTTGLFEPIIYDVNRYAIDNQHKGTFEATEHDPLIKRVLKDAGYQFKRNQILWGYLHNPKFDAAMRSEKLFAQIKPNLLRGVDAAVPNQLKTHHERTIEILSKNKSSLIDHLAYNRLFVTPIFSKSKLELEIIPDSLSNIKISQIELLIAGLQAAQPTIVLSDSKGVKQNVSSRSIIKENKLVLNFTDLEIWTPRDKQLLPYPAQWKLTISLPKTEALPTDIKISATNQISGLEVPEASIIQSPIAFENEEGGQSFGLPFKKVGNTLVLEQGDYVVKKDVILPENYKVTLNPGVTLKLAPNINIISYGALKAVGTREMPIKVIPAEQGKPWGSFAVIRAKERSELKHFIVAGGSEAYRAGLYLSGELCFYSSDVSLSHCQINNAQADDGLNIKKAKFSIRDCVFKNNASDAFDGDWVEGVVEKSNFVSNGGDGIDLSGSNVTVKDSLFFKMGDKAISAGEKTRLYAVNNIFRGSRIGLASKDLSKVEVHSSAFYENKTAVSLYRKKQIFGGGQGEVFNSLFWKNEKDFELDKESSLKLVGAEVEKWTSNERIIAKGIRVGEIGRKKSYAIY